MDGDRPEIGDTAQARHAARTAPAPGGPAADGSDHFGPPTAPSRIASAARQTSTSSGRIATPCVSMAMPPARISVQSTANPNRGAGRVDDAARRLDDLRPDPVARDRGDPVSRGRSLVHYGRPRSVRWFGERDGHAVDLGAMELVDRDEVGVERRLDDVRAINPWPDTTSAPGPSSDERRQRTSTWPWASSPAETALISYSVRVGCQPRTGWSASSTALNSALTGPLPVASALRSRPSTLSVTVPVALPPWDEVTLQPDEHDARRDLGRRAARRARGGRRR